MEEDAKEREGFEIKTTCLCARERGVSWDIWRQECCSSRLSDKQQRVSVCVRG